MINICLSQGDTSQEMSKLADFMSSGANQKISWAAFCVKIATFWDICEMWRVKSNKVVVEKSKDKHLRKDCYVQDCALEDLKVNLSIILTRDKAEKWNKSWGICSSKQKSV